MISSFISNSPRLFRFLGLAPLLFVTLLAQPSMAEEVSAENRALAEVLFRDAKALADKEQYEQACPKFQESHRIDPKPGTILNLAVCHEKQGKLASAWLDYLEAASFAGRAGQKEREAFAKEQAEKLDKSVPRLVVRVPETTPGMIVKLDATILSDAAWGSAMPVNPGDHVLEAAAPGYTTWATGVRIANTPGNVEVSVPKLKLVTDGVPKYNPKGPPRGNGSDVVKPPDPPIKNPPPDKPTTPGVNKPLWIGVGLGAVGLAGMIYGTAYGVKTLNLRDAGNVECGPAGDETYCTQKGLDLQAQAAAAAPYSTVGFIVGGLGLGAGAALIILGLRKTNANSQSPTHAWVLPHVDRTGVGLSGGISF